MNDSRRKFIQKAGMLAPFGLAPGMLAAMAIGSLQGDKGAVVTLPSEQITYYLFGREAPVTIMIGKDQNGVNVLSFCKEIIYPNDFIPVHKHGREDEILYIQQGQGQMIVGDERYDVMEGSAAFIPMNEWHGLKNTGETPLIMIFAYTPAGFEHYFSEIGARINEELLALSDEVIQWINEKYAIEYRNLKAAWEDQ